MSRSEIGGEEAGAGLVLVADDDADIRELIRIRLEGAGYRVVVARDGAEAVRLAAEHGPDLLVFDMVMPGKTGFEALHELREDRGLPSVPAIMLTATVSERQYARVADRAAFEYMRKPLDTDAFLTMVGRLIEDARGAR